ncbi:MAG: choice-of-anchor Q domain-containing protein, partial [Pyrinomonadaceae bacterium]
RSAFVINAVDRLGVSPIEISAGPGVTVELNNLTISRGHSNNPNGGGITLRGGATLNLLQVSVDNNTTGAENGGGIISNGSVLNITDSLIINNHMLTPGGAGAGIGLFGGSLTIKGSLISGNKLGNSNDLGGAGVNLFQVASARIENSTISNNLNGNYGAGIKNEFSNLRMSNVTVSNNSGGVQAGGLANLSGTAILRNCTIAGNSVTRFGGGIFNGGNNATLSIANTVIADNSAGEQGADVFNFATLSRLGNNIVETAVANSGSIVGTGSINQIDPGLLELTSYGGPIPTRAIRFDSLARNAGISSEALDTQTIAQPLSFDGRGPGFPRIMDGSVDIGAFESPLVNSTFTVGGRIAGAGRVLPGRSMLVITDLLSGVQRYTLTSAEGAYRFSNLAAGGNYRVDVISKRATFTAQFITVFGDLTELNFAPNK